DQRVDQLLRAKWLCQDDGAPMPLVHCASVARLEQKWYTASEQFIRQAKGVSARKPHVEHGSVRPLACYQLPSFRYSAGRPDHAPSRPFNDLLEIEGYQRIVFNNEDTPSSQHAVRLHGRRPRLQPDNAP